MLGLGVLAPGVLAGAGRRVAAWATLALGVTLSCGAAIRMSPLRFALPALLAGCGVASLFVVGEVCGADGEPTTYSAVSPGAATLDLGAGLGLLAAGGAAAVVRPVRGAQSSRHRVGVLVALVGVAWLHAELTRPAA